MKNLKFAFLALVFLCFFSCKNDDDDVRPVNLTADEIIDNVIYNHFNSDGVNYAYHVEFSELIQKEDEHNSFEIKDEQIAHQNKGFGFVLDVGNDLEGITIQFKDKWGRISDDAFVVHFDKDDRLTRDIKTIDFFFEDEMPDVFYYEVRGLYVNFESTNYSLEVGEPKEVKVEVRSWGGDFEFNNNLQLHDFWYVKQHEECPSGINCSSSKTVDEYNWPNNLEIKSSDYQTCSSDKEMKDFTNVKEFSLKSDGTFYMELESYFETDYEVLWSTEFTYELDNSSWGWGSCKDKITRVDRSAKYYGKWSYDRGSKELTIVIYKAQKRNSENVEKEIEIPNGWVFMNRAVVSSDGDYIEIENTKESIDDFSYSNALVKVVEKENWRFNK